MLIGIVGKPNVGKSTFFKAATLADAEIANYPFATIKPNEGVGYVKIKSAAKDFGKEPNPREGYYMHGWRFVPVKMIDVAGLVPGAHEGKGMGNQFLDDLRQADVLIHVIDISGSTNEKGEQVQPGEYDPAEDVKFLEVELDMWYLGILMKGWQKFSRTVVQERKEIHLALGTQLSGLHVDEVMVDNAIKELSLNKEKPQYWTEDEMKGLATALRQKTKPMIIACNKIDVPGADANLKRLQQEFPNYIFVACSSESELALKEAAKHDVIDYVPGDNNFSILDQSKLNEKQTHALTFIKETILTQYQSTGVQDVIDKAVFELLEYMAIFPGGVTKLEDSEGRCLPDCFMMPPNTTALDFAYKLHSDFGKNFIRAIDVRTKRTVGKEHLLQHRDVVEIVAGR
ncbi:redox-regulated ATPase YchF [Candidatus Woesearchaeota archaeon]|jgi:ribosome-binding ATPase|nr:redox-regulated ATPase YchF [Candidatus Woesearchaeota archaeon]MBT5397166.1 redox-regulated ATPase YchF [Candidatus Woesearchaeota archaeon]MBT5924850.1 redox-regulated ATPase YchF [Candidatus Woesearchaeota archaeon]MBT6367288.1 redox-regulated ATPase YchF [Candidatus Woesearchaeota archaeon]MBT7762566.1 redox-regulated ATPase YchF [Candidatus Woesearchaeota archaeon]